MLKQVKKPSLCPETSCLNDLLKPASPHTFWKAAAIWPCPFLTFAAERLVDAWEPHGLFDDLLDLAVFTHGHDAVYLLVLITAGLPTEMKHFALQASKQALVRAKSVIQCLADLGRFGGGNPLHYSWRANANSPTSIKSAGRVMPVTSCGLLGKLHLYRE